MQKDTDDLTVFVALLGSLRVEAASKMLVKSTPGRHTSGFSRLILATHTSISNSMFPGMLLVLLKIFNFFTLV